MKSRTTYELSPAAEEAAKTGTLKGAFHANELLDIFSELRGLDRAMERRESASWKFTAAGIGGLFLSFFVSIVLLSLAEYVYFVPLLALVAGSIGALRRGSQMRRKLSQFEIPNELEYTLAPVLRRLSADVDARKTMLVELNLGIGQMAPPSSSSRCPRTQRLINFYPERIGSLELPLADGNRVVLRITNLYVSKVRSRRTASNKLKSKAKWKKTSNVTGIFLPKSPTAAWVDRAIQGDESVRFKDVKGITTVRIDRRFQFESRISRPAQTVSSSDVLSMLVRLSAIAHQGIQGAK